MNQAALKLIATQARLLADTIDHLLSVDQEEQRVADAALIEGCPHRNITAIQAMGKPKQQFCNDCKQDVSNVLNEEAATCP